MTMLLPEEMMKRLIEAIRLLAAKSDDQISVFPDFVHKPDEIALVFDDCFDFVNALFELNLLNKQQVQIIEEINRYLEKMSGKNNAHLWTIRSLQSSDSWAYIRQLAHKALEALKISFALPSIYWLSFVEN